MADAGPPQPLVEINPGTRTLPGTLEAAEPTLDAFAEDVAANLARALGPDEPPIGITGRDRVPEADTGPGDERRGGRFGWRLTASSGYSCVVLIPGTGADAARELATSAPCLAVDGEWSWWSGAVMSAGTALLGPNLGRWYDRAPAE